MAAGIIDLQIDCRIHAGTHRHGIEEGLIPSAPRRRDLSCTKIDSHGQDGDRPFREGILTGEGIVDIDQAKIVAFFRILSVKGQAPVVSVSVAAQGNSRTALLHPGLVVRPHETENGPALSCFIFHGSGDATGPSLLRGVDQNWVAHRRQGDQSRLCPQEAGAAIGPGCGDLLPGKAGYKAIFCCLA